MLTIGTGVAATLLAGQIIVGSGYWQPATALYVLTAVSVPFCPARWSPGEDRHSEVGCEGATSA
jgi:hypothetical protein